MSDTETPVQVITDEDAKMLAQHAIFVQGGYSTPEIEKERAERAILAGHPVDLDAMRDEVRAEMLARAAALGPEAPAEPTLPTGPVEPAPVPEPSGPQRVSVTAVMPDIDSAVALRARIKALQTDLKNHEQAIKDVLGTAVEGVDSTGKVVVTYPTRNRTNLVAAKVKAILSDDQYASCQNVTPYRTLLFDGD